ncbi:response regulator [Neptunicella sp.]|uniref:response regulator n=1 Tax=Neptunicella sp. TaxID=2125986 RepID=UPI003F692CF6
MRILLVEDDRQLAEGLQKSLRSEGFAVDWVDSGKNAIHAAGMGECDMVILDLGLPDLDGIEVLKAIRKQKSGTPVLVLTARDSTQDKIQGLDYGADDYLVKPFEPSELFARLRVFERRLGTANSSLIEINEVCLDTAAHSVMLAGKPVDASRREYMVLKALMENAGRIQSREQLESKLYEWGEEVASNVIEVHIHNLRKKLPPQFIKTIRGVGYSVNKT